MKIKIILTTNGRTKEKAPNESSWKKVKHTQADNRKQQPGIISWGNKHKMVAEKYIEKVTCEKSTTSALQKQHNCPQVCNGYIITYTSNDL